LENDWELEQLDFVAAYLNSFLDESAYMEIPEGLNVNGSLFVNDRKAYAG